MMPIDQKYVIAFVTLACVIKAVQSADQKKDCCPSQYFNSSDDKELFPSYFLPLTLNINLESKGDVSAEFPKPPFCGKTKYDSQPDDRIIGGHEAQEGKWPWMAVLGINYSFRNYVYYTCGGSIISTKWILTAAHCYQYKGKNLNWTMLGTNDLKSNSDSIIEMKITMIINNHYDKKYFNDDIALARLEKEIKFSDNIRPLCLPFQDELKDSDYEGEYAYVAGWGTTSYKGAKSNALLELQQPIVNRESCATIFARKKTRITSKHICAGFLDGKKDTCQGDSGGPLMLYSQEYNAYFQIGITSFGVRCAVKGYPSVYTRVAEYLRWISSTVKHYA